MDLTSDAVSETSAMLYGLPAGVGICVPMPGAPDGMDGQTDRGAGCSSTLAAGSSGTSCSSSALLCGHFLVLRAGIEATEERSLRVCRRRSNSLGMEEE